MLAKARRSLGVDRGVHPAGFHPVPEPYSQDLDHHHACGHSGDGQAPAPVGSSGLPAEWPGLFSTCPDVLPPIDASDYASPCAIEFVGV
jgi:hypothetical protein